MSPVEEEDRGSWSEYRRLVVSQLEELKEGMDEMQKTLAAIQENIAAMRAKAAAFGAIGGVIFGGLVSWWFSKR